MVKCYLCVIHLKLQKTKKHYNQMTFLYIFLKKHKHT